MNPKPVNLDLLRLRDIVEAIESVEDYRAADLQRKEARDAACYNVTIMGEAANKLSAELKAKHPEVPWKKMIGMRHRLVHDYGRVDVDILIEVIHDHLPPLKQHIQEIIKVLAP